MKLVILPPFVPQNLEKMTKGLRSSITSQNRVAALNDAINKAKNFLPGGKFSLSGSTVIFMIFVVKSKVFLRFPTSPRLLQDSPRLEN